jgi:hypothetical protein
MIPLGADPGTGSASVRSEKKLAFDASELLCFPPQSRTEGPSPNGKDGSSGIPGSLQTPEATTVFRYQQLPQ